LVTIGLLLVAAGNAGLTSLHPGVGGLTLLGPLLTLGVGVGLCGGIIDAQAMNQVDPGRTGMAAGLLNTVRGGTQAVVLALFGSALISLLRVRLGSADTAGKVATGVLVGERRDLLAEQLTDAWRIVLWTVAGLCVLAALAVRALLSGGEPARRGGDAAVPAVSSSRR
jgi:hypothetical protein